MPDVESIAPNLFVSDVRRSLEWYVRVLQFRVEFQSATYAGVRLGPALIVLAQRAPPPHGACHIRLRDGLDAYAAQIEAAGQQLAAKPADRPEYGVREACVRDPDGNDLYLGQQLA